MYYVYCLQNQRSNAFYFGYTADLRRRYTEHKKRNWKLVYYEAYTAEEDARRREKRLKQYGQARSRLKKRIADSLKK